MLKFIGDGLLAIFPLAEPGDSGVGLRGALAAAREAQRSASPRSPATRGSRASSVVRFGLALHIGEVLYGNIGGGNRLDFTCIGPAVNLAARLEALAGRAWPHRSSLLPISPAIARTILPSSANSRSPASPHRSSCSGCARSAAADDAVAMPGRGEIGRR